MKIHSLCLAFVLAFGPAGAALAQQQIRADMKVDDIIAKQNAIRTDMQAARNGWETLTPEKRSELTRQQEQVFALLQGKRTIGDLAPDQQAEVTNLLSSIETTATGAEDERMICVRERKMGSNFPQRVCRTMGQMRRERESTQGQLQDSNTRRGGR